MILLIVSFPRKITSGVGWIGFSAEQQGGATLAPGAANLEPALLEVNDALSGVEGIIEIVQFDKTNEILIAYNPAETDWRQWYVKAIYAITEYYDQHFRSEKFHTRTFEVVSRINAYG